MTQKKNSGSRAVTGESFGEPARVADMAAEHRRDHFEAIAGSVKLLRAEQRASLIEERAKIKPGTTLGDAMFAAIDRKLEKLRGD